MIITGRSRRKNKKESDSGIIANERNCWLGTIMPHISRGLEAVRRKKSDRSRGLEGSLSAHPPICEEMKNDCRNYSCGINQLMDDGQLSHKKRAENPPPEMFPAKERSFNQQAARWVRENGPAARRKWSRTGVQNTSKPNRWKENRLRTKNPKSHRRTSCVVGRRLQAKEAIVLRKE